MFCENCGKELREGVKFCSSCGAAIQNETEESIDHQAVMEPIYMDDQPDAVSVDLLCEEQLIGEYESKPTRWSKFKHGFMVFRGVCCFTSSLTLIAVIAGFCLSDIIPAHGFLDHLTVVAYVLGLISTVFACPLRLFKVCFTIISTLVVFGFYLLIFGSLIGGAIGIGISAYIIFFGSAFISIPYFFTTLRHEI